MAQHSGRRRIVGVVVGGGLALAAAASVFLLDWRGEPPAPEVLVRPLKTLVVGPPGETLRSYPALVRSRQEVTRAFQVPGVLIELPAVRGLAVNQGDLLARLDLRDFESRLAAARARHEQTINEFESARRIFEQGALGQLEFTRVRTAVDLASAERDIAAKALEDATMLAPFDGIVADVFVDNHENVAVGRPILRLQDTSRVRVQVNVPEERIAHGRRVDERFRHRVRFDFLPDRAFDAELVEITTQASAATQTFLAIFELEQPEGVSVLPGMTATLLEYIAAPPASSDEVYVPVELVVTEPDGGRAVWVVQGDGDGGGREATVRRTAVEVGELLTDVVAVRSGLTAGQRIAAAGVHQLADGQRVTLLGDEGEGAVR